jgi:16S rRNA C967 or C1407 C5-methylase (RsmB/RsmF family)
VGGKISYSTCSLNPIENESVIAAILKMYGNKIKLLDVSLEGFKFESGLTDWKFMVMK